MRIGVNPEKFKNDTNIQKKHRVILVFFIPNVTEEYYLEALLILDRCLYSLFSTININYTAVTLINNNSCKDIDSVINKYINQVDKYIIHNENKGKVYSVMEEARSCYEEFITISDSDVLFLDNWQYETFNVFENFPQAGVVSPVPAGGLALNHNRSVFFDKYLFRKIKHDKIVSDYECELYKSGLGNPAILNRNNRKYNWQQRQYYIENKKIKAVLGATHFVATYRKKIFSVNKSFPQLKFINGYEDLFIDKPSDVLGYYRLSTLKHYSYHMGNRIDDFVTNVKFSKVFKDVEFNNIKTPRSRIVPYRIRKISFSVFNRLFKL